MLPKPWLLCDEQVSNLARCPAVERVEQLGLPVRLLVSVERFAVEHLAQVAVDGPPRFRVDLTRICSLAVTFGVLAQRSWPLGSGLHDDDVDAVDIERLSDYMGKRHDTPRVGHILTVNYPALLSNATGCFVTHGGLAPSISAKASRILRASL